VDSWFGSIGWVVAFLALVAGATVTWIMLRRDQRRRRGPAEQILDERFARGEIDSEDYRVRRDILARSHQLRK